MALETPEAIIKAVLDGEYAYLDSARLSTLIMRKLRAASMLVENRPAAEPDTSRDPAPVEGAPPAMLRVGGKPFACRCKCNVFTLLTGDIYRCNACSELYGTDQSELPGTVTDYHREGERCPDSGACGHFCKGSYCFRVACCSPLSWYGNRWPAEVVREHSTDPEASRA